MTQYDYDLFTIGAGSGGVRASRMAAEYGAKVGIAEEYRVGGTCVIRGCVPKKLFVYASHFAQDFEDAVGFGWDVGSPRFSWSTLIQNKDTEIDRLNQAYIQALNNAGVDLFQDRAVLKDEHRIHLINEGKDITAQTILIATGGRPFKDETIPGFDYAITSNEAFHLETLPERILIIGGGYIAVEFAGIFNGLGVDTTLLYRKEKILRGFDDDLRIMLHTEMEKKGVTIVTRATPKIIEQENKNGSQKVYKVTLSNGDIVETDLVMSAIGRHPNAEGLGLKNIGVETDSHGAIKVDAYSRSSVANIYAVGDVTDRNNLTPVAIRDGAGFAQTVFNNNAIAIDHAMIPTAVFSQPEIGTVGLTEVEARAQYSEVDIYKSAFRPMKHTLSGRDERAFMKLVVDGQTDRVLGVHLLGSDSAEMVQLVAIPLKMGATKAQFDQTMALHPTAAEELVTLREKYVSPTLDV